MLSSAPLYETSIVHIQGVCFSKCLRPRTIDFPSSAPIGWSGPSCSRRPSTLIHRGDSPQGELKLSLILISVDLYMIFTQLETQLVQHGQQHVPSLITVPSSFTHILSLQCAHTLTIFPLYFIYFLNL